MSLYDYFTRPGSVLLKPDSLLSTVVPASIIVAANEEVEKVISTDAGYCLQLTTQSIQALYPEGKGLYWKRAVEHGVTATVQFFPKRSLAVLSRKAREPWSPPHSY